jgi:hypothetical protein
MANKQTVTVTGLQEALDSLTVFQRVRIPGSIAWSLNKFAVWLREQEKQRLTYTFDKYNAFTLNAPLFKLATKQNPRMIFFLRDNAAGGNSPDRYLEPQVSGGPVYVTRFSRALRRAGAIQGQEYVVHWDKGTRKATPGFISSLVSALTTQTGPIKKGAQYARNLRSQNKYFIVDETQPRTRSYKASSKSKGDSGYRGYGIYTKKGNKLDLVYHILKKPPTVKGKYDWNFERMSKLAEDQIPILLFGKLSEF